MSFDPAAASTAELFSTYRAILRELRSRSVVRTGNAPTGDYAEWLVARHLSGKLAPNSEKSFDVTDPDGRTYQVKSRMVDGVGQGKRQLSPFRSWEFDDAVIVLFHGDYTVMRAAVIPCESLKAASTHRQHVNGDVALATDDLMDAGEDITEALRSIAGEADALMPLAEAERAAPTTNGATRAARPGKWQAECARRAGDRLGIELHRVKGNAFASSDGKTVVVCFASKKHEDPSERYWFGFYSYQLAALESAARGYLAFGCGSANMTFLVPAADFLPWLEGLNSRPYAAGGLHWQVQIEKTGDGYELRRKDGHPWISVSEFLLPSVAQ